MKKLLAIFLVITMVVGVTAMTAMATNEEGFIPFTAWHSVGNGAWGQSDAWRSVWLYRQGPCLKPEQ